MEILSLTDEESEAGGRVAVLVKVSGGDCQRLVVIAARPDAVDV